MCSRRYSPSVSRRQAGGQGLCVSPRGRIERLERDGAREVRARSRSEQSAVIIGQAGMIHLTISDEGAHRHMVAPPAWHPA